MSFRMGPVASGRGPWLPVRGAIFFGLGFSVRFVGFILCFFLKPFSESTEKTELDLLKISFSNFFSWNGLQFKLHTLPMLPKFCTTVSYEFHF